MSKGRVVFGVIGDDIHVVANRLLHMGLLNAGFQPFNIGTHNIPEDFVEAAIEVNADAVLLSSINGEGEHWCQNFRARFARVGLAGIHLYAGGNLVVGDKNKDDVIKKFTSFGFNRVFYQSCNFDEMLELLAKDIKHGPAV